MRANRTIGCVQRRADGSGNDRSLKGRRQLRRAGSGTSLAVHTHEREVRQWLLRATIHQVKVQGRRVHVPDQSGAA